MLKPQSDQVFDHARKFATPFRTSGGQPWAIVPDGAGYRGYPISSHGFEQWLSQSFHSENFVYPAANALEAAISMFATHAAGTGLHASDVFTRIGWRGDPHRPQAILLHLANAPGELIEITADGHHLARSEPWLFLTGSTALPLPRPIDNKATLRDHLRPVLNLTGIALDRAVTWLFAALRPTGPYPVLSIGGPAGSGKSTLASMLRSLIDPSGMPLLIPPANEQHLLNQALHNHILAYDHAAPLPLPVAESVAHIAAGTGVGVSRPVIITSKKSALPPCFAGVAMQLELTTRGSEDSRTVKSLAQRHQAALPRILGTLCAAVSAALSNIAAVQSPSLSRFPDAHRWTLAAATVLGLTEDQILRAFSANPVVEQTTEVRLRRAHS